MLYEQFFAPVLVVDDEPLILRELVEVVKAFGYFDVRQASSFEQARAILAQTPVAALIADVALPDGDGRRLALEAMRANNAARIVLITGFPVSSLILPQELRSHAHLLEKPFGMRDLRAILDDIQQEFETVTRFRP